MSTTAAPFTPTPFILKERFTRIDCPLDGYEGLWFEVRLNLSNGELQVLRDALQELDDQTSEISEHFLSCAEAIDERRTTLADGDTTGQRALNRDARENHRAYVDALQPIGQRRRDLVAPHIRAWNLYEPAADGAEPVLLPPPREQPDSLNELSGDVILWLCREVIDAYRGGSGFSNGSGRSGTAPEPTQTQNTGGPQILEPSSPSRRSRRTSSGPKASA